MKKIVSLLACLMLAAIGLNATVVSGKVSCNGAGIAGVSVSDGVKVVLTAADGSYKLKTPLELGYVFISVPSGYEAGTDGVIPRFFCRLDASAKTAVADFELSQVDQSKCNILFFNDIHLTHDPVYHDVELAQAGFFKDVREHAAELAGVPLYAMTLGDMTTDSRWYKRHFGLPEYLEQLRGFPAPVFHVMGNHDNDIRGGSDDAACKPFREVIGPYYWSVNIGGVHFVALDDIVYDMPLNEEGRVAKVTSYKTFVEARQLAWLKNDLRNVPADTPVVIMTHAPFYRIKKAENGVYDTYEGFSEGHSPDEVLYRLRGYKNVSVLSGHTHMNYYVEYGNGILEHNCVAVAGSSWYTPPCCGSVLSSDGIPGGYAVYTIENGSFSWYYKPVGVPVEEGQFRAYDINRVPAQYRGKLAPNTVLVNVFNYDPAWKVRIVENGRDLAVRQTWVADPLYACAVEGKPFSQKGAFKPHKNSHMFTAQASSPDSEVVIIVTDRFGREFRQSFSRPAAFLFNPETKENLYRF